MGVKGGQASWLKLLGIELSPVSHRERPVSALGGLSASFCVQPERCVAGPAASPVMVLSMVPRRRCLFAVPHEHCRNRGCYRRPFRVGPGRHYLPALGSGPVAGGQPGNRLAIGAMHHLAASIPGRCHGAGGIWARVR